MGTSKRLVLALLVSSMMVLALGIGLLPTQSTESATAAGQAGRLDMVDLLNEILSVQKADSVTLASSSSGLLYKTPADNAATPPIVVPLQATLTGGDVTDTVHFVANDTAETPWTAPDLWAGDALQVSDVTGNAEGYAGQLDLGAAFYEAGNASLQKSILIYALVNAVQQKAAVTLQYETTNAKVDAVEVDLQQTSGDLDADNNGLPDDAFNDVAAGEAWVSVQTIGGQQRTVLVLNLDDSVVNKAVGEIVVKPSSNVSITVPNLDALIAAGVVDSGESAVLVASVVGDLAAALDSVDGVATPVARQAWADEVASIAPAAAPVALASYVDVSILYTQNSGSVYSELEDLAGAGLSVGLDLSGLDMTGTNGVQLWSYPTAVDDLGGALVLTNDAAAEGWRLIEPNNVTVDTAAGTLSADLTSLSIFAPYDSGMALSGVSPARIPANYAGADVTLTGVFPTATALSIAEAEAAYEVTIGGQTAPFRLGPAKADAAITAYDGASQNVIYVDSPAIAAADAAAVTVTDLNNPSNTVTLNALDVTDVYTVTVQTRDSVSSAVTAGGVALSPGQSADLPADYPSPAGKFFDGDSVSATLGLLGVSLVGWEIDGVDAGDDATLNFTVTADTTITAITSPLCAATLTLQTQGLGVVTADPAGPTYACNTLVALTATPSADPVYHFVEWQGPIGTADPEDATISIVMDADKTITAVFEPGEPPIPPDWGLDPIAFNDLAEVWMFGGVVGQINGTGFVAGTTLTFSNDSDPTNTDVAVATVFVRTPGVGEVIIPAAPASWFDGGEATVVADILAETPASDTALKDKGITFKQYDVADDGVTTTAFIIDPTITNTIAVWDGASTDNVTLELPALGDDAGDVVYGIARTVQIPVVTKSNTEALGTSAFDSLLDEEEGGDLIPASYDFSMHLYSPLEAAKTTPEAGAGIYYDADVLAEFGRTVDVNGNPVQTGAALLTFPLTGSGITAGDVRDGLLMWGVELNYDYAAEQILPLVPQAVAYQSELLNNEVNPALTDATPNASVINLVNQARLYSLNGFSLRQNAVFDEEVAAGIRLDETNGVFVASNTDGGDALRIVSALGGLGWVDRIEFVGSDAKIGGVVDEFPDGSADGTDEYELSLESPASADDEAGVCDLVIYLKSAPTVEAARLERVFEYKAQAKFDPSWLLLLLGLVIAIIGLAAGGDSGGGGGGPCFIATAAYGTPMATQIDTLRDMRDVVLLDNAAGSAFVDTYYSVSPAVADVIAQSPLLAALVRIMLMPIVVMSRIVMAMPMLSAALALAGSLLVVRRRARRAAR